MVQDPGADPEQALQQLAQARWLYEKETWFSLLSLKPMTLMDQRWQLMAQIRQNNFSVLNQLSANIEIKYDNFQTLLLIFDTHKKLNNSQQINTLKNQLLVLINARLNFYAAQNKEAITDDNKAWSETLNEETQYLTDLSTSLD